MVWLNFGLLIISGILRAVTISCLWGWFVVPLGVPHLKGLWHAYGLSSVVAILTMQSSLSDEQVLSEMSTEEKVKFGIVRSFGWLLAYGLIILFSWFAYKGMGGL